jgi:hypothetical protein
VTRWPEQDAGGPPGSGARRRILVAEDQLLVALDYEGMLNELDCAVLGPMRTVADGLAVARYAQIEGAVLNIRLSDGFSFPIATVLRARGIPFFFVSGYNPSSIPPSLRDVQAFSKPVDADTFIAAVRRLILHQPKGA